MNKKWKRCALCWSTYRPEIDHINENHHDNSPENIWILCKYHHVQKGIIKLGRDDFQALINAACENPKLRRTLRFYSELRMSQLEDADMFPLPDSFGTESDIYTKIVGGMSSRDEKSLSTFWEFFPR